MPAYTQCIFLAGAPEIQDLLWNEANLLNCFEAPIKRFLREPDATFGQGPTQATPLPTHAKWRYVSLDNGMGNQHRDHVDPDMTQFLSLDARDRNEQNDEFLERSLALLEDIEPAHILPSAIVQNDDDDTRLETTFLTTTSFTNTSLTTTSLDDSDGSFRLPPTQSPTTTRSAGQVGPITDLKRIPNADYIARIQPQTVTVNLVVGIISISTTRTVRLRRRAGEMDIMDLTVGDETRAGFSISFWLVPVESQRKPTDDLRSTLQKLRTGDVVFIENIALSCFRACVFGQSLSRRFARNSTSISVVRDDESRGPVVMNAKVGRVRQWTRDFIGGSVLGKDKQKSTARADMLPPDTQD